MTDVESSASSRITRTRPTNPYNESDQVNSRWHPINFLSRTLWMGGSLVFLDRMNAYHEIMNSPNISHQWFKVGLAASLALFSVKAYVEIYTGKLQKQEVTYKALPQVTHAAILLILLSGIAFHIALWPVYGGQSMFVMFLVGAFLLNFCLMFPTTIQNIVGFALLTFFIQEYK